MPQTEQALRRSGSLPGDSIRLADGQSWTLPAPPEGAGDGPGADRDYEAAVAAVLEAEDRAGLRRAELALAICLLDRNYDLGPGHYARLLGYAPGDPGLDALQRRLHDVAMGHVHWYLDRRGGPGRPRKSRSLSATAGAASPAACR